MQQMLFGALLDAEGPATSLLAPQQSFDGAWTSGGPTTRDGLSIARILHDRPDVFRAFHDGFYGGGYDRDPAAWAARVGGVTVEAYANYWYEQHGRWEGYSQGGGSSAAAPLEPGERILPPGIAETGRTVAEGHLISHILAERPDVYRAFFTEFYGPNNDRNSDAWINRVGGTTVEDYANYWWETYGRVSGWVPSSATASSPPEGAPDEEPLVDGAAPLVIEYTDDGVVLRPAEPDDIVEDGVVVGRRPPDGDADSGSNADEEENLAAPPPFDPWEGLARPLVIELRADGGVDLRPAMAGEIIEDGVVVGYSLFGGDPFA